MGADDEKKRKLGGLTSKLTPSVVLGTLSFVAVTALLLQERSYRKRLEHEQVVEKGICESQAYRPQLDGAAELFPVRESPHGTERPECNGIVFVQSDTREINLDFKEIDFRNAQQVAPGNVPGDVRTLAAMSNRGYAMEHGYCHVWAQCFAKERSPSWCKVKAVEYALDRWKESDVIYLDSDAYIRTHRPIDMSPLRESGAQAAFTLGCEWFPFVHQAMGLELGDMSEHTSVFHEGSYIKPELQNGTISRGEEPWPIPRAIVPSVFVVMKAWDIDQQETAAIKFVREWWNACPPGDVEDSQSITATLNDLVEHNASQRQSIALLDYPAYNGADGMFIRHLSSDRGDEAAFKHDLADTLIRHADKTTLYFTELFGDIFRAYISV